LEIRILRGEDVKRLLPMTACIDLMEATMIAVSRGEADIPLRGVTFAGPRGKLGNMPGYLARPECFGVKLVSLFPGNHAVGLSSHLGLVLLFEAEHGRPVAIMDAAEITAIRTAAASGLATRCLARDDAGDLAILGAGEQARGHLEAMLAVRPIRRARVWSRTMASAQAFAAAQGERHGIVIEPMEAVRDAVAGADLICAVSTARAPILPGDWIEPGCHLNVVGSSIPAAAEIDTAAVVKSRFFVDLRASTIHEGGEYLTALAAGAITPDHILAEIGEVASGARPGRLGPDDITLYKSLGIAAQDLASAYFLLEQARAQGVGQTIDF
jgi:ornithine cyclodeaminase